jgi:hypothetical protein
LPQTTLCSLRSQQKSPYAGLFYGRYWARTSDPQLVESPLERTLQRTRTNTDPCHPCHARRRRRARHRRNQNIGGPARYRHRRHAIFEAGPTRLWRSTLAQPSLPTLAAAPFTQRPRVPAWLRFESSVCVPASSCCICGGRRVIRPSRVLSSPSPRSRSSSCA